MANYDAIIVGAGHNGLTSAHTWRKPARESLFWSAAIWLAVPQ